MGDTGRNQASVDQGKKSESSEPIEDEGMLEAATDAFKEKGIYCTIEENNGEKYLEIIWEG